MQVLQNVQLLQIDDQLDLKVLAQEKIIRKVGFNNLQSVTQSEIAANNVQSLIPLGEQNLQKIKFAVQQAELHIKQIKILQEVNINLKTLQKVLTTSQEIVRMARVVTEGTSPALNRAGIFLANILQAQRLMLEQYDIVVKSAEDLKDLSNLEISAQNFNSLLPMLMENADQVKTAIKGLGDPVSEYRIEAARQEGIMAAEQAKGYITFSNTKYITQQKPDVLEQVDNRNMVKYN